MTIEMNREDNISNDKEAYYETVASQEEIYLEETEETIRAILVFDDSTSSESTMTDAMNTPRTIESIEQVEREIEDLLTGDADDPPLSQEEVEEMVRESGFHDL